MNRIHQGASVLFVALGAWLAWQGTRLGIQGMLGPGKGFFAFWVGLAMTLFAALWFVRAAFGPVIAVDPAAMPPRDGVLRVVGVLVASVAFMLLLRPLGFNLSMFGLLLAVFFIADRSYPLLKIAIAIVASFGIHYVFEQLLRVPLPYSSFETLSALGL
jgi:hypothetical protein